MINKEFNFVFGYSIFLMSLLGLLFTIAIHLLSGNVQAGYFIFGLLAFISFLNIYKEVKNDKFNRINTRQIKSYRS